jgi:hypothetical protein
MPWLKVDDGFPSHEKVMALSEGPCRGDAIALWTFCGCWSSHALREGFVPNGVVRAYAFHPEAASELVRVKLWVAAEGGYQFHDWADYQPSAAQVEERRRAGAERKARSRAKLSAARVDAHVGESRRDSGIVTGVPRIESRTCLADASRDRERESAVENSSSENSARALDESAVHVRKDIEGFRFVAGLLGRNAFSIPPVGAFVSQYTWIGSRPAEERLAVAASVNADEWCIKNPQEVDAPHLQRRWQRYLRGRAQPVERKLEATPQEQQVAARAKAARAEFNAQIQALKAAGDDFSAELMAAKRDEVVARIQAQAS